MVSTLVLIIEHHNMSIHTKAAQALRELLDIRIK